MTPKPKTPSMLCQSEKDVTALPTNPVYVSACRAAFGIAPTPTGLCAGCRAMPHDERLALSLRVVEDTLSQLAAGRDWRLAMRSAPRPCDERTEDASPGLPRSHYQGPRPRAASKERKSGVATGLSFV